MRYPEALEEISLRTDVAALYVGTHLSKETSDKTFVMLNDISTGALCTTTDGPSVESDILQNNISHYKHGQ